MLKSLSLKYKILLGAGLPFILFIYLSYYVIQEIHQAYSVSSELQSKVNFIEKVSYVIHETQKERGMSALFLANGTTLEDLNGQRSIVDQKISEMDQFAKNSGYEKETLQKVKKNVLEYSKLREAVTNKTTEIASAIKNYTQIIQNFLILETQLAKSSPFSNISSSLFTLRTLEDGKEAGGKLRANMASIFSNDKAISIDKFNAIIKLKAAVDTNINASSLILSDKSIQIKDQFLTSSDWENVNDDFMNLLKKADQGNYQRNGKEFFSTITKALNIYGRLVLNHKKDLLLEVNNIKTQSYHSLKSNLIAFSFISLFVSLFLLYIIKISSESIEFIRTIGNSALEESHKVSNSSQSIADIAGELSEAAVHQASNLQQTVSSINEIASMVQKNTESINESNTISKKSTSSAQEGKNSINKMVQAINEIHNSNEEILLEVNRNNEELTNISNLITQIGDKTQVINDIVFQTKLLSFNASVEAARAGEHGKGFAVVAEEVGNLANMSGQAALEISNMIETSVRNVQDMVRNTTHRMKAITESGKTKIDQGIIIAKDCENALVDILQNIQTLDKLMGDVHTASKEQSLGIQEINGAMQQLDLMTGKNTQMAKSASLTADELEQRAKNLSLKFNDLMSNTNGNSSPQNNTLTRKNTLTSVRP